MQAAAAARNASVKTRAYADFYFRSAQRFNTLNWTLIVAQSIVMLVSGVLLATDLVVAYAAAKYALAAISALTGFATPFIGKINAGARSDLAEKAGNAYAVLSFAYERAAAANADANNVATAEKLNERYVQFIEDYDEPPAAYIEQRFAHLLRMRGDAIVS